MGDSWAIPSVTSLTERSVCEDILFFPGFNLVSLYFWRAHPISKIFLSSDLFGIESENRA